MDAEGLRALQQPLKDAYRSDPAAAVITLRARGDLGEEGVSCSVETGQALAVAGLHPATGGDGTLVCSGDMRCRRWSRAPGSPCGRWPRHWASTSRRHRPGRRRS